MKKVVIIGGGFGGLFTARNLQNHFNVTLINDGADFLFTPLLHEVATGSLSPESLTCPLDKAFKGRFLYDKAKNIDFQKKEVHLTSKKIEYDYLVIATGSKTNYYGNSELEKYVLSLKNIEDAKKIRSNACSLDRICIVGGGPTGIELACEMVQYCSAKIVLIAPSILAHQDSFFSDNTKKRLKKLGIRTHIGVRVSSYDGKSIVLNNNTKIKSEYVIWTAGVTPSTPIIPGIAPPIKVNSTLQVRGQRDVFALGDCAACPYDGGIVPWLAQSAEQQAIVCAQNIIRMSSKKPLKEFVFKSRGFLISLGNGYGLAEIGNIKFKGLFAWFVWRTVYLMKNPGFLNKLRIMIHWTQMLFRQRVQ